LAENIPFLRLKVEGKKVEGNSFSLKTLLPSISNGPDPDNAGVGKLVYLHKLHIMHSAFEDS